MKCITIYTFIITMSIITILGLAFLILSQVLDFSPNSYVVVLKPVNIINNNTCIYSYNNDCIYADVPGKTTLTLCDNPIGDCGRPCPSDNTKSTMHDFGIAMFLLGSSLLITTFALDRCLAGYNTPRHQIVDTSNIENIVVATPTVVPITVSHSGYNVDVERSISIMVDE